MTGIVHLVGAGPGDPDLLTVKARRLLDRADVVVHDRLVSQAVLDLLPSTADRFDVGKVGGGPSTPQDEITGLLIRLAGAGRDVVRLKGGDPFVFGRGGEEALALVAAGVAVDVVPGVSSGIAAPALAGIPVTHRGLARSVVFVTGHEDPGSDGPDIDWAGIATVHTVVAFMAGRTAGLVARRLMAAGRSPETPVAVVTDGTLPEAVIHRTDLGALAAAPVNRATGQATLLVIGEVAELGDVLGPARQALAAASAGGAR